MERLAEEGAVSILPTREVEGKSEDMGRMNGEWCKGWRTVVEVLCVGSGEQWKQ